MHKSMDQIPKHDRPREKLLAKGAGALTDQELLAVLLGKGTPQMDVMTLAAKVARIMDEKGLDVRISDLKSLAGIGQAKAALVLAAMEYARRRIKPEGLKISTPADVLPLIRHFADRKQEHFLSITINGANEVLNVRVVSIGLVDRSPVHPREVFADALGDRASGIIVAHNHPSGSLEPSDSDLDATSQLRQAGKILGIELLDHIVFNRSAYYSFLESGQI
ncbi:MAG: DNA repair protein RadC [Desulfosarcina sp.]|nr:DNA repair protein RadC [Desulfosarcina sp.]MBC2742790.1 DNA repair protein RadC [Desulfosarcina sp.]MBC2765700.1 DNA repair protein RadC [Desulfosarcina sp.]